MTNKYVFIHKYEPELCSTTSPIVITHELEAEDLNEIISQFIFFLKGCGFYINAKERKKEIEEEMGIEAEEIEEEEVSETKNRIERRKRKKKKGKQ